MSARIVEQIFDVPVLLSWRRSLKLCDYPLERILHRTVEEIEDVLVPLSDWSRLLK